MITSTLFTPSLSPPPHILTVKIDSFERMPIELFYMLARQMLNKCENLSKNVFEQDRTFYAHYSKATVNDPNQDLVQIVFTFDSDRKCHLISLSQMLNSVFKQQTPFLTNGLANGLKRKFIFNGGNEYVKEYFILYLPKFLSMMKKVMNLAQKVDESEAECFYYEFKIHSFMNCLFDFIQHFLDQVSNQNFFQQVSNGNLDGRPVIEVDAFRSKSHVGWVCVCVGLFFTFQH